MNSNEIKIKLEALTRLLMVRGLSGILPLYVVTEYPKSGGTWVGQMLSEYLGVPFPRNRMPVLRPSILHGHYRSFPTMKNVFVVIRDGRDIMVSYYYHCLFERAGVDNRIVKPTRKRLALDDYNDIRKSLPRFIEDKFTKRIHPRFTLCDFIGSWMDKDAAIIRYERLLESPADELSAAIGKVCGVKTDMARLTAAIEKFSFKNQTSRDPGQEDVKSFLRKGISGDWKNHFTKEARAVFHHYAGEHLIKQGYEPDDSWVGRDTF